MKEELGVEDGVAQPFIEMLRCSCSGYSNTPFRDPQQQ
jgi:hypothetical protein